MINKVTLIGNLGKDPEVRHLENGSVVARLTVATNENYKDKSGEWQTITEWHNVVVWRYLAEMAERDLKKGSLVFVEGKLTTRKWQDKEGNDRYTTEVVGAVMKSLERKEKSGMIGGSDSFPSVKDEFPSTAKSQESSSSTIDAPADDDLPF